MGENCPASCRGEPAPPWRHVAEGLAIKVQHSTHPVMEHVSEFVFCL